MDGRLLEDFDRHIRQKGYANRSEAVRDLVRNRLVEESWAEERGKAAATVTLVYDHHKMDVSRRLMDIQHHHAASIVSTTHVHLDNDNCLEVVILRGEAEIVRQLAEEMCALKGVKHGKIALTTEGKGLA